MQSTTNVEVWSYLKVLNSLIVSEDDIELSVKTGVIHMINYILLQFEPTMDSNIIQECCRLLVTICTDRRQHCILSIECSIHIQLINYLGYISLKNSAIDAICNILSTLLESQTVPVSACHSLGITKNLLLNYNTSYRQTILLSALSRDSTCMMFLIKQKPVLFQLLPMLQSAFCRTNTLKSQRIRIIDIMDSIAFWCAHWYRYLDNYTGFIQELLTNGYDSLNLRMISTILGVSYFSDTRVKDIMYASRHLDLPILSQILNSICTLQDKNEYSRAFMTLNHIVRYFILDPVCINKCYCACFKLFTDSLCDISAPDRLKHLHLFLETIGALNLHDSYCKYIHLQTVQSLLQQASRINLRRCDCILDDCNLLWKVMAGNISLECTICMQDKLKPIVQLCCGHVFHQSCLNKWVPDNNSCPNCRSTGKSNKNLVLGAIDFKPEQCVKRHIHYSDNGSMSTQYIHIA
jgi:hypothetical protein